MHKSDVGEARSPSDARAEARLADEIIRFFRLGARAKGMLNSGDLGAEFSALMLLFPLRFLGPMRVTDLAEAKQADPSTVSRQAAQLVRAGLVRREADPGDGRASRLAITDAGLSACRKLHDAREGFLGEVLSSWPNASRRSSSFSPNSTPRSKHVFATSRPRHPNGRTRE
jgi:DNA-binding MarR family transcriptional regulator